MKEFFSILFAAIECKIMSPLVRRYIKDMPYVPITFYENWLLQKIEPILNNERISDTEKIETIRYIIEHYDFAEY